MTREITLQVDMDGAGLRDSASRGFLVGEELEVTIDVQPFRTAAEA